MVARSRRQQPGWGGRLGVPRLLARQYELADRRQGYSYQVCLSCRAKRLFDEKTFTAYGPFRYDLNELTAWEGSAKPTAHPMADASQPPAS